MHFKRKKNFRIKGTVSVISSDPPFYQLTIPLCAALSPDCMQSSAHRNLQSIKQADIDTFIHIFGSLEITLRVPLSYKFSLC